MTSKEDLLASLSMFSTEPQTVGEALNLEELNDICDQLGMAPAPPPAGRPTRAATNVKRPRQRLSVTGRPEEMYQVITKKAGKTESVVIGNYQLGQKLGQGAFGEVFKGLDLKTGKFVAIKQIEKGKVNGKTMMKEINFLKTFNHPNIVSYITLMQTEQHLNVVLEFVDSGSLSGVLAGYGFFPESLAAIYTIQVLEGLDYLHQRNVIHRDIKGGNILITKDGSIKLADFGIATIASSNPRHSLVEGSPYWMAPEAIEMSCNPTTKSDIWSLGCTLIELVTGVPPYFEMSSVPACYKMVTDEHPPLPPDISKELRNFLLCCFCRNVETRPDARELMKHPWIMKHVHTTKPTNVEQVRRSIKRFTMGKEGGGSSLQKDLKNLNFDAETFEEAVSASPPSPVPSQETPPSVRKKRSSTWSSGKIRTNSTEIKKLVLTIFSVETKRSLFTYTIYHIKVDQTGGQDTYNIERTWSDFHEMHAKLSLQFPSINIPPCPAHRYWGVMDPEFVRKRWQELQQCANGIVGFPLLRASDVFQRFIAKPE